MRKLTRAKDEEGRNHELHCWVHDIPFNQRTEASCNCDQKKEYKKNFYKLRNKSKDNEKS